MTERPGSVRQRINRLKQGRSREVTPEERTAQVALGSALEEEELLRGTPEAKGQHLRSAQQATDTAQQSLLAARRAGHEERETRRYVRSRIGRLGP
jgi:hypothetical protein